MLREQAALLRDLARAPDQHPEILADLHRLARDCEQLAEMLERSPEAR